MAISIAVGGGAGCKEEPPLAPSPEAVEPPAGPSKGDKPAAPESLAAPVSPAAPEHPQALPTPKPAAPTAVAARGEAANPAAVAPPASPAADPAAPPAEVAAAPPAQPSSAAPAQETEPPPKEVMSPKLTESAFNLWMQSSGRYKAGQQGVVEIVLVAKGNFHCNEQYPYKFKASSSPGVTFPQDVVRSESMSKGPARSVMRVPFVPTSAGEARVAGKFHFSVCTSSQCLMDSRDVAVTVKVD